MWVWGNSASRPTRVWVTPCSMSNTGLSNLVFHFRRRSEKPYVSLQARVWATWRSTSDAGLRNPASHFKREYEQLHILRRPHLQQATRDPCPARDPRFCCNRPPLLGQLTLYVMGELIPIMEGFSGTIIPLWLPINSLSYYGGDDFFGIKRTSLNPSSFWIQREYFWRKGEKE